MGYIKDADILNSAIDHFGVHLQMIVAVEELSELQKELTKFLRGKDDVDAIAEEIADVEIMIEQLKIIFGLTESVKEWRRRKLRRLEEGIYGEQSQDIW